MIDDDKKSKTDQRVIDRIDSTINFRIPGQMLPNNSGNVTFQKHQMERNSEQREGVREMDA